MSENKAIEITTEDKDWARKLKRKVGYQPLRSTANAIVAQEVARAIEKKQLWRLNYLLTTPLPSLFSRRPALPDPETVFKDAWSDLFQSAQEKARYKLPSLYDRHCNTPLETAVLTGFFDGVAMLLEKGGAAFHVMPQNPIGYGGALGASIFHGKNDMTALLMKQPAVQKELQEKPEFRNWLLLTAVGTDCAATLAHLAVCDPDLLEKGRIYGDHKAAEFTLGEGIFADKEKLKAKRAFDAAQNPPSSKYGNGPKYRPHKRPDNEPEF